MRRFNPRVPWLRRWRRQRPQEFMDSPTKGQFGSVSSFEFTLLMNFLPTKMGHISSISTSWKKACKRARVPPRRRRIPARSYRPSIAATLKTHGNVGLGRRKQTQLERGREGHEVCSRAFHSPNRLQSRLRGPWKMEDGGRQRAQNGTFVVSETEESPSLIPISP